MTDQNLPYDYILAGGGLSGQMMALELRKILGEHQRVLIIDKDAKNQNDRTWSYWSTDRTFTTILARKVWDRIEVKGIDFHEKLSIDPYHYATIRGIDFYNFTKKEIAKDSRFEWIQAEIVETNDEGFVKTTDGTFQGNLIFKSYFEAEKLNIPTEDYSVLYQQFKGWFVKTEQPIFDENTVTFMDFTTLENTHETRFFYILPFSKNEALVEYTAFTANLLPETVFDQHLEWYFKEKLPTTNYKIEEKEFDFIPMTDFPFPKKINGKVVNIGTTAAFVKASTGYCFARTQQITERIVHALKHNGKIVESDLTSPYHFRLFDSAMLEVTGKGTVPGERFFISLFKKVSPAFLFRFLDEKASLFEIIKTMLSVPDKGRLIAATLSKMRIGRKI